jgi:SPP1 family predicted phage head-tail adaptor
MNKQKAWTRHQESGYPSIDPGLFRHVVTIQQYGPTSPPTFDAAGPVLTWTTFATARAHIEIIKGKDVIKSGQTVTETYIVVTIRRQAGIAAKMRVVATNGTYVIQSIENVEERNRLLNLLCLGLKGNE